MLRVELFFSFMVILFLITPLEAQQRYVLWSDATEVVEKTGTHTVMGPVKGKTYIAKSLQTRRGTNAYIEVYNKYMELSNSSKIKLAKNRTLEEVFHFGVELYVLSSTIEQQKKQLFLQKIDKQKLTLKGKEQKIGNIKIDNNSSKLFINKAISNDNAYLALCFAAGSNLNIGFRVHVIDTRGTKIWSSSINLPYKTEMMQFGGLAMNSETEVFVLLNSIGKWEQKAIYEAEGIPECTIIAFKEYGEEIEEYQPQLKDTQQFLTASIHTTHDNGLMVAGLFRQERHSNIQGAFAFRYDSTGIITNTSMTSVKLIPYKETGYTIPETLRTPQAESPEGKNWKTNNRLLHQEKGGFYFTSELHYPKDSKKKSAGGYRYFDLIVSHIDEKGNVEWVETIPKFQQVNNQSYGSYNVSLAPDRLLILFNDVEGNITVRVTEDLEPFEQKAEDNLISMVVMDKYGSYIKRALTETEEYLVLLPSAAFNLDPEERIIYVQQEKTNFCQLGKIRTVR